MFCSDSTAVELFFGRFRIGILPPVQATIVPRFRLEYHLSGHQAVGCPRCHIRQSGERNSCAVECVNDFSSLVSSLSASSLTVSSLPFFSLLSLLSLDIASESSFNVRLTLTAPPSRKSRLISPIITGKA